MSKKSFINQTHVEGLLYQYDLSVKVTGENSKNPGTSYISGKIDIATDNNLTNIVSVHYTYVTATTSSGKANSSYALLMDMAEGKYPTVMKDGADKALKLRIDSAIGLNEFYTDRDGKEELVSAKRNDNGFIHIISEINPDEALRNTFKADILITGATRVPENEERGIPEKVIVKGAIFNFRKDLLPVEFSAVNPAAMDYFEGLGATSKTPVFTCVWGRQISEVTVRKIVEESAFGEDSVREVRSSRKDFVITGGAKEPYEWDSEETLTAAELVEMMAKRETNLAAIKQRRDEYKASQSNKPAVSSTPGGFNF